MTDVLFFKYGLTSDHENLPIWSLYWPGAREDNYIDFVRCLPVHEKQVRGQKSLRIMDKRFDWMFYRKDYYVEMGITERNVQGKEVF